jgi:hypothetical protein
MCNVRLWLVVALTVVALIPAACSNEGAGPTTNTLNEGRTDGDIYGYVYDAISNEPLSGVPVVWVCTTDSAELGSDDTDTNGRYDIYGYGWLEAHGGHDFLGTATAEGYQTGYEWIYNFGTRPNVPPIRRDFYLYPGKSLGGRGESIGGERR